HNGGSGSARSARGTSGAAWAVCRSRIDPLDQWANAPVSQSIASSRAFVACRIQDSLQQHFVDVAAKAHLAVDHHDGDACAELVREVLRFIDVLDFQCELI